MRKGMKDKTELLAPAGNFEKLKTALYFGADAVYLGGKSFSLRSFSDNFDRDEMKRAIDYAHALGRKVYVTVNIFARNKDFGALAEYFASLQSMQADAALVTDAGVLAVAKKAAPALPLHISTQANTTNKYAAKFWQEQGAERVVLARELSISEIGEIKDFCPELELEAFVHGAMCISYSGRCLLSNYLAGRDSNRGECVQACRWKYYLRAEGKDGEISAEEDDRGTYIFNSKDLNMSAHLAELAAAGVDSFKIEGRMKSAYYVATVVNTYRRLLDGTMTEEDAARELDTAAHRDYTQAYAFGANANTVHYADSQAAGTRIYAANVLEGAPAGGAALIEMRNRFRIGEELEILSPTGSFGGRFTVEEMRDEEGEIVLDAKRVQQKLRIFCPYELCAGDLLRKRPKGV